MPKRTLLSFTHSLSQKGLVPIGKRVYAIVRRVAVGCFNDGFIHAGNLAYMAMLAIFPFFITGAAIFAAVGEESERTATISTILAALPPVVAEVIAPVAYNVVEARSGWLLWIGGLVGLWTVSSLIETIRDILRRSYGTQPQRAFWMYRLLSTGIVLGSMLLLLVSFVAQVVLGTSHAVIAELFPELDSALRGLAWSQMITGLGLFGSIYLLFLALTPPEFRDKRYPKWPGPLLVAIWWGTVTALLPKALQSVFSYDLIYGSLAGMMIALFFFWLVGLGMVAGAELNAAIAITLDNEKDRDKVASVANAGSAGGTKEEDVE